MKPENDYMQDPRAGLIPFLRDESGKVHYLMMVAADSKFGGPRPMISKGKIEHGETPRQCAIREAEEELGLKGRNLRGELIELFEGRINLYSCAYDLYVFGAEIQDRYDFDKWCDETSHTEWHDLESFRSCGRRDHITFVEKLEEVLTQQEKV